MLFVSYFFTGKDLLTPATMLIMVFLFSSVSAMYKMKTWQFSLGNDAVVFILLSLTISILINMIVHYQYRKAKFCPKISDITPIADSMVLMAIMVLVMTCFVLIRSVLSIAGTGGSIATIMQSYRAKSAYSTDIENQLPMWVRQIINLSSSICYIFIFNIIYFWKELNKKQKIGNILVVCISILSSLITGGRFSSMCTFVAALMMFHLIKIKRTGKYRIFNYKSIIRIIILVLLILYGFYAVKELVGRKSDDTIVEYITHYAGGSVPGFDLYLKYSPYPSNIWGKETFYSLINTLRRIGVVNIPYYYIHHEFRLSNGVSIGNVYTALRDYHYDFGVAGMFLLHTIFTLVFSVFYEIEKKRCSDLGIIVYSMMYYCVVFYSISNYFYANIVALGFIIRVILIYLLYMILLRKQLRIKIW